MTQSERSNYNKAYNLKNKLRIKELKRIYNEKFPEKRIDQNRLYRQNNKEKVRIENLKYKAKNKDENKAYNKKYKKENSGRLKLYGQDYFAKNKKILYIKVKKRRDENKELYIHKARKYRQLNRKKINKNSVVYAIKRKKTDSLFRLTIVSRNIIGSALKRKNHRKNSSTRKTLGCDYEFLKKYLESMFEYWMGWDNYGLYNGEKNYGWDIDHIIPLSSEKTEKGILMLNHYTNLQPLCSKINRDIKRNKITISQVE